MNFILEKLKSKTVNSPHDYERKFWYVIAAVFAITLVVLAAPFLIASYLGYKAYYKSSWQKGERWSVIALLALLLALTGPPWVSAFFDGGQSQAKNQVVNNQNTQDVVNIKRNNTNRVERATTSTSSAEATKNQATTSTSSGKKEDKELTNKSDAKTTDESSRDTEVNQRLSQSASTSNQNSNYGASGVSSANVNADSPTQDSIEPETNLNATIINVVDGDTADVRLANGTEKRLRLIGIDTPETKHPSKPVECFGKKATQKARSMLLGEQVTLEYDDSQGRYDKYDRLLTYVILPGGTNFNEVMVEKGYAYEYTYNVPYKYQDEFKQAERLARVNERGLWAPETCDGDRIASDDTEQETMDNNEKTEDDGDSSETEDSKEGDSNNQQSESSIDGYWYASGYHTAEYYYHESCEGWEDLSKRYLQKYETERQTREDNPDYELHPDCEVE